jgi:hypothetical protein
LTKQGADVARRLPDLRAKIMALPNDQLADPSRNDQNISQQATAKRSKDRVRLALEDDETREALKALRTVRDRGPRGE